MYQCIHDRECKDPPQPAVSNSRTSSSKRTLYFDSSQTMDQYLIRKETEPLTVKLQPYSFKIITQNLASLTLPSPLKWQNLIHRLKELDIDILCASEHNANSYHPQVHQTLRSSLSPLYQHTKLQMVSTPDKFTSMSKRGGTLTLSTGKNVHRIKSNGQDKLGHWSWTILYGKPKPILLVNAYMPSQRSPHNVGPLTYYSQLRRSMRKSQPNYEP